MKDYTSNLPYSLTTPPKMGDQTKLPPFPAAQQYASAFGCSADYAQTLIEDVLQQTAQTSKSAAQCAFCGVNLAHHESAGLVVEYAGLKFCGETCLNSWIDGEGK